MPKKKLKGRLSLRLVDVYGKPIKDQVVVALEHRKLSHRTKPEKVAVKGTLDIDGLHEPPNGEYILRLTPTAYRPWAQFVNTAMKAQETIPLYIKPEAASPSLPTYEEIHELNPELVQVLERSDAVEGHKGKRGAELWSSLENEQKAALLNIGAKAIIDTPLSDGSRILPHISLRKVKQDRCFANVPQALPDAVKSLSGVATDKPFRKVSGGLHTPPTGYRLATSHKTKDDFGNLQFTFFRGPRNAWAADIDIDNSAGIRHAVDVIKHKVTKSKTHPYDIHEILVDRQKLDPGYTLKPKKSRKKR